ncbi:hypothetical protein LEP1GSC172_2319 [Leptospira noguchii]|uniref:Uncharacterized protein n=1 Tax=Leptospira noguchii TaxID=28182 RepID=M6VF64_9LEPT|nr:hypothetical protein LEP1GSC172_2319 [Leptospira noguchii]
MWSLIFYGWITLPIGAFLGWFFTKYKKSILMHAFYNT